MKHYKVIALSVGGPGNQIFHSGMIVTDEHFQLGHADKLVKSGYLEEIKPKKADKIEEPPPAFQNEDLQPEVYKTEEKEEEEAEETEKEAHPEEEEEAEAKTEEKEEEEKGSEEEAEESQDKVNKMLGKRGR